MTESTNSLQALRRAIASELRMDFYRRYPAGYVAAAAGCTATKIISAALTQEDNYWAGAWLYSVASQGSSYILQSSKTDTYLNLEVALTSAPSAADALEILNIWNAYDIHKAINQAIEEVNRTYIDTVTDETLVVQEKKLQYNLSSLAKAPWVIAGMYVENVTTVKRGTVVSAGATTFTVESAGILSDVDTNWKVSIYGGTGAGQLRSIVSVLGAQGTVTAWTVQPDTTSKYCLWNPSSQVYDWIPSPEWYTDAKEYPDYLNLKRLYMTNYGLRMRLVYIAPPGTLSAEADTTIVPKQYILYKACSILHGQALNNTKADHNLHLAEFQRYGALADAYKQENAPHKPDIMMKSASTPPSYFEDDPLGWFNKGG